jgi:hypothetical protein
MYCNEKFSGMYRGGDLATQSRHNSVGAQLQMGEKDILALGDAARISESLNYGPEQTVLQWWFGYDVVPKARTKLMVPKNEDLRLILSAIQLLGSMKAPFAVNETLQRFGFTVPEDGEELLQPPPVGAARQSDGQTIGQPERGNATMNRGQSAVADEDFLRSASQLIAEARREDLATLRGRIRAIVDHSDPVHQANELSNVIADLPGLLSRDTHQLAAWERVMGERLVEGLTGQ